MVITIIAAIVSIPGGILGSVHSYLYIQEHLAKRNTMTVDASLPSPSNENETSLFRKWCQLVAPVSMLVFIICGLTLLQKERSQIASLQRQLAAGQTHFELTLGGLILSSWDNDSTRFQLVTTVFNSGAASTAHGWKLHIANSSQQYDADYFPGQSPIQMSYKNESADTSINVHPLETGAQVTCFVYFLLPHVTEQIIAGVMTNAGDPLKMTVSVMDKNNTKWTTDVDALKLSQQMIIHSTNGPIP